MEKILESNNLIYVKINEQLITDYLNMINDRKVSKYLSAKEKKYTYEDEMAWIKEKLEEKATIFSIIEKATNKFVGNIELANIKDQTGELEISITKTMQDKHYGIEAMKKIINYAFDELKLDKINLIVYSNNNKAIHCYEKLGFKISKIEKDIAIIEGQHVDDIFMQLTKN